MTWQFRSEWASYRLNDSGTAFIQFLSSIKRPSDKPDNEHLLGFMDGAFINHITDVRFVMTFYQGVERVYFGTLNQ